MKLLMITQVVDEQHKELGAYNSWINEIAKRVEFLTVICLQKGDFSFPSNVKILSLGKENGESIVKYIKNLFIYLFSERNNYNTVFVHMNQEYIILAGILLKIIGKKILFWRNHKEGNFLTTLSCLISDVVFYTSPSSFTAKFSNAFLMPTGINISKFRSFGDVKRIPRSILSMGRISKIKKVDTFLDALVILHNQGTDFKASIVGDYNEEDADYYTSLKFKAFDLINIGKLEMKSSVPNTKTPEMYHSHEIFVNMTHSGSLDKMIFSAMASGTLVVLTNDYFRGILPDSMIFEKDNAKDLSVKIKNVLDMNKEEKERIISNMKKYVDDNHSLEATISQILKHAR